MTCPNCGNHRVTSRIVEDKITYGSGERAVELPVTQPVRTCGACQQQWTDAEGEEARDAAVAKYLSQN